MLQKSPWCLLVCLGRIQLFMAPAAVNHQTYIIHAAVRIKAHSYATTFIIPTIPFYAQLNNDNNLPYMADAQRVRLKKH